MRKVKIFVLLSLLLVPVCVKAQANWDEYEIGKIFKLSVPSTLMLRDPSSIIGKMTDDAKKKIALEYGIQSPDWTYTFIPNDRIGSSKYARVIVSVSRQNNTTQKMVKEASQAELQELRQAKIDEAKQYGQNIKNTTCKKEVYDGRYAIVIRYDRPGLSGDVHVDDYYFFLLNKKIEVTISYRISEAYLWKNDFNIIPSTFSFE